MSTFTESEKTHIQLAALIGKFCNEHRGAKHPLELNMEYLRKKIPHTKGENPPNKQGLYLCYGNCSWSDGNCDGVYLFCLECGYAECHGCAEDFCYALEDLAPEWEGHGIAQYCRGCGSHTSQVEVYHKLKWLLKQIYGDDDK